MKKMVLTKGIVLSLLLSFPLMAGASEHGQASPEHGTAPAVHETGHMAAPVEHAGPAEHMAVGHDMQDEHTAPVHGESAGHEVAADAHEGGHEGSHEGGHHHGPILSGVTDPIGTGFLTYIFIMTIFIIPIAVHNENKKHAHGHDAHGDAHGGHDAHGDAPGHDAAHHVDNSHGAGGAHGGH